MTGDSTSTARWPEASFSVSRMSIVRIDGEFAGRSPAGTRIVPDTLTLMVPPG